MGEFNSAVGRLKGRLDELKDGTVEIPQAEQVDWKRDVWNYNEKISHAIGIPGEEREWDWKKYSKKKNGLIPQVAKVT